MYVMKTVKTPWCIFYYKHYSYACRKKGGRGAKIQVTSEQQKRINKRIASHKRLWTICEYFRKEDYFLTLTYRRENRPESIEEAVKLAGRALAKLSRRLKKQGVKLSYMHVCERGERGGVHHHLLIKNNFDSGELFKGIWEHGKIVFDRIYTKGVVKLAEYFVKGDSDKSEKKFTQSRDLVCPKPRVQVIKAERWAEKPRGRKGYDIVNFVDGIDGEHGTAYQGYMLVKRE